MSTAAPPVHATDGPLERTWSEGSDPLTDALTDRREEILRAAGRLFARQGASSTTVRQIAEEVGVTSGSLYHHFRSKEDILDEIVHGYLQRLARRYVEVLALEADPRERFAGLVRASFAALHEDADACEMYQNEFNHLHHQPRFAYLDRIAAEIQRAWVETLEEGMASGAFRSDVEAAVVHRFLRDSIWCTVRWRRRDGREPDELAADCLSVFLRGIDANPQTPQAKSTETA